MLRQVFVAALVIALGASRQVSGNPQPFLRAGGLMVTGDPDLQVDWDTADNHCSKLKLGGYDDWRLPTIEEMRRLNELTNNGGCAPGSLEYPRVTFGCLEYWAADDNGAAALSYGFSSKRVTTQGKGYSNLVICIRTDQEAAAIEKSCEAENLAAAAHAEIPADFSEKGPKSAPVTLIEFADFQCPFSARLAPTLKEVRQKYGERVRIVFRQFPLKSHYDAEKAAEAALCAGEQGKFWELHDAMFVNQKELAVDFLKAKARALGMNVESFGRCLDCGKKAAAVRADIQAGEAMGVEGTPAMFVNGHFVSGAVPFEEIARVIDDELRRKNTP